MPVEHAAKVGRRGAESRRGSRPRGLSARPWWPKARRALTFAFLALVAWLLVEHARDIEWHAVLRTLRDTPASTLLSALALALASYAVYCTYDLMGRHQTGHSLRTPQVLGVGFVSYAFNLNLGALVGGVGMRYKLYARLGLQPPVVSEILGLSILTNWMGYSLLAGTVFTLRPLQLPPDWLIGTVGVRGLGVVLLGLVAGYLGLCFLAKQRTRHIRGHEFTLPSGAMALLQLGVSSLNWLLIASIVFVLLRQQVAYTSVLAVLLIAAVAGVIAHVPAGLGVLEAVFLALLSQSVGQPDLLAALLAYRAVYYLLPLSLAVLHYFVIGSGERRTGQAAPA